MTTLRYGSVCSGVGGCALAIMAAGLDWRAAWFAEIDRFASALLKERFPHVPNLGDFTRIGAGAGPVDLLVGGTPCQSFSIAGKRAGLDDPRGNLTLEYLALARRLRPRWLVWENVAGVLSDDGGRTFGTILGLLGQLGYGFAWRVFDAQFAGVPQRRRRVFLVGHLGDWRRAAAVLVEPESLRGDPPPSREAGEGVADALARGVALRGREGGGTIELGDDVGFALRASSGGGDKAHILAFGGNNTAGPIDVATCRTAHTGAHGRQDFASETFLVAHSLRADGFDASEDGTGRGTPLVVMRFDTTQITHPENRSNPQPGDLSPSLAKTGHAPAIAIDCEAGGKTALSIGDVPGALRGEGHGGGHAAVAFNITPSNSNKDFNAREASYAQALTGAGGRVSARGGDVILRPKVRRLTPLECERLMGFPDHWTAITYRGKPAADGPRYRAIGNGWAIPDMAWIFGRVDAMEGAMAEARAVA